MRNYEFFATCVEREIPGFLKVLRALPSEQLHYRPHERNKSAGELGLQIADEITALGDLFDTGEINMKPYAAPPATSEELAQRFEKGAKVVVEKARATNEEKWAAPAKFLWDGHSAWEARAAELAWGFLFDLIHHRGQLTVYIRPMGGKVPAVYGPSGDEQS